MEKRNIIVLGASAGGFEALKELVSCLPADLHASLFIVWHMAADLRGILPQVLNRYQTIPAAHGYNGEEIQCGRIYVAPPDHHMLVEDNKIKLTRGPKENRFRPAVDPLFRSAAVAYGNRVIGIILSGALDDGTAGLWAVKHYGGTAIAQDPDEADVPSMPRSAINSVDVDHVLPIAGIAELITRLSDEEVPDPGSHTPVNNEKIQMEVKIAMEEEPLKNNVFSYAEPSPYACPECHGVLAAIREGNHMRFRCHTGHAYSADSLLSDITEKIEESLWSAVRSVQESVLLLNHMGDHFAEANQPRLAATYFKKAQEAEGRSNTVRQTILTHEKLSADQVKEAAKETAEEENATVLSLKT